MRNSTEKNRTEMPPKKGQKMDLGAFLSNDGLILFKESENSILTGF